MNKLMSSMLAGALLSSSLYAGNCGNEPKSYQVLCPGKRTEAYLGAGVALQSATGFDNGVAGVAFFGLPIYREGRNQLSIEVEGTYSIVSPTVEHADNESEFSAGTGALYGAYTFNLTTRFYIKPRVGAIYRMYTLENTNANYTADDVSEVDLSFGIGAGLRLSPSLDIYADYTMIDGTDLTHMTAGLQFHFIFL